MATLKTKLLAESDEPLPGTYEHGREVGAHFARQVHRQPAVKRLATRYRNSSGNYPRVEGFPNGTAYELYRMLFGSPDLEEDVYQFWASELDDVDALEIANHPRFTRGFVKSAMDVLESQDDDAEGAE